MNNKPCGCGKAMPPKAMPRMPRCMAMKPGNTCRNNNWSNENTCSAKTCEASCNRGYEKKEDNYVMPCARNNGCGCTVDWAKKYENSCTRNSYRDGYDKPRKYRRCNKGCELTFGEEVDDLPIGMGYVPYQEWDCNVSNACQGLYDGTIFPELVKPFVCTYCYEERSCQ